jgi:hypothetical protein
LSEGLTVDSEKCRDYAIRCYEMANEAANEHAKPKLLNLAKAWLKCTHPVKTAAG